MRGAIPPLHIYALMTCTGSALLFVAIYVYVKII
jgi:hypothetical protein